MYYPDGTIQHAGVTVGLGGAAGHHFRGFPADSVGLAGRCDELTMAFRAPHSYVRAIDFRRGRW